MDEVRDGRGYVGFGGDSERRRGRGDSGFTTRSIVSDSQCNASHPIRALRWSITHADNIATPETATRQVLTREEALIAHTPANALMIFQEANLGAIKPGLLADFVVLDRDCMTIPLEEIRYIQPVATIVGGKVVYASE